MPADRSSGHPGRFDPNTVRQFMRFCAPVVRRMWPTELTGLGRLPSHDRYLVVANHSGMGTAELWAMILAWYDRFGGERPIAGLAHPAAFKVPPIAWFLRGFGAVEATYEGARWAREHGAPLLVFPGGDVEAMRPAWRADEVTFHGRMGWIRIAREHGLEIVPLCVTGSHVTNPMLGGGRWVATLTGLRLLGVHRAPLTVLGVGAGGVAYRVARGWGAPRGAAALAGWAAMMATMMVPWVPSRLGLHVLPPLSAETLASLTDAEIYERVVSSLQARLRQGTRAPKSGARVAST